MAIGRIIGLGNPDARYTNTYHNIGHRFVDFLNAFSRAEGMPIPAAKSGHYMNESGRAVAVLLEEKKLKSEEFLVVHDDSDIALGRYKLSFDRSSGGHKGVQSIIDALGTQAFWRLRIGIRKPPAVGEKRKRAEELVLESIASEDEAVLSAVFQKAADELRPRFDE